MAIQDKTGIGVVLIRNLRLQFASLSKRSLTPPSFVGKKAV